ncbi:MAG TPA: PaaI family thioesterase [Nocardioidaceae bacterium]|nr:PaaI family thioesterase [Nocardioidaceae bacterium]
MDANSYQRISMSLEEMAEHDRVFGALAERTRELIDASLHTTVDHATVEEVTAALESLTARLSKETDPSFLGVKIGPDGSARNHGNAVVGLRNPFAPPLKVEKTPDGTALASFRLGAAYEGPPDLVHGGVSALILDQMLGEAAAAGGAPGMTGRLTLTYRRPTPLGDLSAKAWIHEVDGHKTTVKGHIVGPDGEPTVEAEGLFILPRWAREAMAEAAARKQGHAFE